MSWILYFSIPHLPLLRLDYSTASLYVAVLIFQHLFISHLRSIPTSIRLPSTPSPPTSGYAAIFDLLPLPFPSLLPHSIVRPSLLDFFLSHLFTLVIPTSLPPPNFSSNLPLLSILTSYLYTPISPRPPPRHFSHITSTSSIYINHTVDLL
ncbi:hypothetical protein ACMFMF_004051 [Clarireedia jacksonii]